MSIKKRSDPRPYELIQDGSVRICLSDGFGYVRNSTTEKTEYWRCRCFRTDGRGCAARAIRDLRSDEFFLTVPHVCDRADFVIPPQSRMGSLL